MLSGISGASPYLYMNYYQSASRGAAAPAEHSQNAQRANSTASTWTVRRPSNLDTPVQPVDPVKRVNPDAEPAGIQLPVVREGADPAEMAVRMRITPFEDGEADAILPGNAEENAAELGIFAEEDGETEILPGSGEEEDSAQGVEDAQEALEEGECQTCEKRKYQDGSDDMTVSFQSPTNIKPEQVASAVRGHEMEHVIHEQVKAKQEGRKVVSQNVTLHTAICPECGKVYISGGETRTVTKANPEQTDDDEQKDQERERKSFSVFG